MRRIVINDEAICTPPRSGRFNTELRTPFEQCKILLRYRDYTVEENLDGIKSVCMFAVSDRGCSVPASCPIQLCPLHSRSVHVQRVFAYRFNTLALYQRRRGKRKRGCRKVRSQDTYRVAACKIAHLVTLSRLLTLSLPFPIPPALSVFDILSFSRKEIDIVRVNSPSAALSSADSCVAISGRRPCTNAPRASSVFPSSDRPDFYGTMPRATPTVLGSMDSCISNCPSYEPHENRIYRTREKGPRPDWKNSS